MGAALVCAKPPKIVKKAEKKHQDTTTSNAAATTTPIQAPVAPVLQPLYVILPYFNYCNFKRRKELFLEFVERYYDTPGLVLCIVEAALHGAEFQLPNPVKRDNTKIMHFRVITQDPIWLKENLINIGVKRLPADWQMMAWIDADVQFLNTSWLSETKQKLASCPNNVLQLFQTAANLGPTAETYKIDTSFAYQHALGNPVKPRAKYTDWHPGFAWACSRTAYYAMGGLIDWAILGSGDRHMALAIINSVADSCPSQINADYKNRLSEFQMNCQAANLGLGYVTGTVMHFWHGRLADRKYRERWDILVSHAYCPMQDICRSHRCGLIQLTEKGKRMTSVLHEYFEGRREDNVNM